MDRSYKSVTNFRWQQYKTKKEKLKTYFNRLFHKNTIDNILLITHAFFYLFSCICSFCYSVFIRHGRFNTLEVNEGQNEDKQNTLRELHFIFKLKAKAHSLKQKQFLKQRIESKPTIKLTKNQCSALNYELPA